MSSLPLVMIGSAFIAGLAGGVHCAGMCGGIVGAISRPWSKADDAWRFHLAYNGGRIASYGFAGLLVGALGSAGFLFRDTAWLQQVFALAASLLLLGLGLSLAGFVPFARRIEVLGAVLWRQIQPFSRRFLPVTTAPRAFAIGLLWGWLPCGLVYTVLLTALASADSLDGAMIMLAFGFGTLPNLVGIGALVSRFKAFVQSRSARLGAGIVVSGIGVYGLVMVFQGLILAPDGMLCHIPLFSGFQ